MESQQDPAASDDESENPHKITVVSEEAVTPENPQPEDTSVAESNSEETTPEKPAEVIQPESAPTTGPKKRRMPGWLKFGWLKSAKVLLLLVLIVNLGIGGSTFYLYKYKRKSVSLSVDKASETAAKAVVASKPDQATTKPVDTKLLHFSSDVLKTEFDYPIDWRIDSTPGNSYVTLTSGKTEIVSSDGKKQTGTITINILTKEDDSSTQFGGVVDKNAPIKADSIILKYTNPTDKQRKQTTLTFADVYSGGESGSDFEAVIVTGNISYKAGQLLSGQSLSKIDPRITIRGSSCPYDHCEYDPVTNISKDAWQNNEVLKQVRDVIASMRFN